MTMIMPMETTKEAKSPQNGVKAEEKKGEKKEISYLRHGTNGETFLQIDKEAQARMGLKTAALSPAQLQPEVQGFGRVLDPSPLSGLIIESASAKAALDASTKE